MSSILVCSGVVTIVDENPRCDEGWTTSTHVAPFQISDLDPIVMTGMFATGFVLFIVPWAAAYGAKQLLSLLK
jgi:hypothetical protein|tara:strand:+ start:1937 stop:2155 length:219 start_codon:yes stop_codon:yes gene_type:complete